MGIEEQLSACGCLTPLCLLAEKYGTDKLGVYTPFYDLLLGGRRNDFFKVLEIGIGTSEAMQHVKDYQPGASLRMWRDYFPNAEVHGMDKDATAVNAFFGDRIITHRFDQRYQADLEDALPVLGLGGKFDLIVDDGSHEPADQLRAFGIFSGLLDSRGIYIIEDAEAGELSKFLPEHTVSMHHHATGIGKLILIRGEAIHG